MVDPISATVPNININTQAIGAAANQGAYAFAITSLYLLILFGVLSLFIFLIWRNSFNIKVTVMDNTKGGIVIRDNFRGKLSQKRPGEFRFQIFKAKTHKLRYNEESLSTDDLYYDVSAKGRMKRRLFMTFDSEGQLVPVRITSMKTRRPKLDSKGLPIIQEGKIVYEEVNDISALVKQVDIAWYYKEYDKSGEVFDARSFFDKNGWVILVICLILTLGVFLYTSYKFGSAASGFKDVVASQGELIKALVTMRNGTVVTI